MNLYRGFIVPGARPRALPARAQDRPRQSQQLDHAQSRLDAGGAPGRHAVHDARDGHSPALLVRSSRFFGKRLERIICLSHAIHDNMKQLGRRLSEHRGHPLRHRPRRATTIKETPDELRAKHDIPAGCRSHRRGRQHPRVEGSGDHRARHRDAEAEIPEHPLLAGRRLRRSGPSLWRMLEDSCRELGITGQRHLHRLPAQRHRLHGTHGRGRAHLDSSRAVRNRHARSDVASQAAGLDDHRRPGRSRGQRRNGSAGRRRASRNCSPMPSPRLLHDRARAAEFGRKGLRAAQRALRHPTRTSTRPWPVYRGVLRLPAAA